MDMTGEHRIAAAREKVWEALNDPEVLQACIAGAESVEKVSDTEFTAVVTAKVGPVKAKFKGKVELSDIDPPNGYTISGEGQGGVAGFAKGSSQVFLEDGPDGGTLLRYDAKAELGGKLAQIGSRLVDAAAKKMADDFFTAFTEHLSGGEEAAEEVVAEEAPAAASAQEAGGGLPTWAWAGGIIVIVLVIMLAYSG